MAGKYDARVAHVETIGKLFNDTQDVGAGSGLLIGETLIVTNNHVVPDANNDRQLDIFVRLKSRLNNPLGLRAFLWRYALRSELPEVDATMVDFLNGIAPLSHIT